MQRQHEPEQNSETYSLAKTSIDKETGRIYLLGLD
jgi:hypothetical protein